MVGSSDERCRPPVVQPRSGSPVRRCSRRASARPSRRRAQADLTADGVHDREVRLAGPASTWTASPARHGATWKVVESWVVRDATRSRPARSPPTRPRSRLGRDKTGPARPLRRAGTLTTVVSRETAATRSPRGGGVGKRESPLPMFERSQAVSAKLRSSGFDEAEPAALRRASASAPSTPEEPAGATPLRDTPNATPSKPTSSNGPPTGRRARFLRELSSAQRSGVEVAPSEPHPAQVIGAGPTPPTEARLKPPLSDG